MIQLTYEQKNSIGLHIGPVESIVTLRTGTGASDDTVYIRRKRSSDGGTLQPGEADE